MPVRSTYATLFALSFAAAIAMAAQPPVILISIDTLRADHLSAYGYTRIKTPNIDSYAAQPNGTVYANIDAQIPLTLPSHTSLFTSTYPFENQIEENAEVVPKGVVTLASVLKQHGYQTAAFISSVFMEREMGLDQGFDFYDSPFHFTAFSPLSGSMFFGGAAQNPYGVRDRRDGALVTAAATRWLNQHQNQPVFAFLHLFDLHKPYTRGSYDAELAYVDGLLGKFKQTLTAKGWWDKSLVIVISDHGESLGDHGEASHGYFIYQSTLAVPLLVHWPAGTPARPVRDPHPAGLIDVAPTILDTLHIPRPASFVGRSLLSDPPAFVFAESVHAHDAFGWAPLRSIRVGAYKYIGAPKPELYRLDTDPQEKTNLLLRESAKAAELKTVLNKVLIRYAPKQPASPDQISPATKALLSSLGYLAAGPKSATSSGADPKDKLPEFQLYERAQVALYQRKLDEAIALLNRLLISDPHNLLARRDLGGAYLDRKLYAKARAALQDVVKASPNDYVAQFQLAIALRNLGLIKDARTHMEAACKLAPDAGQCRVELDKLK
jgi:arylsulfatase A-like enzyme